MRLLIVSHTPHFMTAEGVAGRGATVREIDHLAALAETVRHLAPLHPGPAPPSVLPYRARNVELVPVPPAGGRGWLARLGILPRIPGYAAAIRRELDRCDAVHVRCPANISLIAVVLLALRAEPKPRWLKYAGSWAPHPGEPLSYRFQRRWLRLGWHKGTVTVNGAWPGEPRHIVTFVNPCLTEGELREGQGAAARKRLESPVKLVYAGRLEDAKGAVLVVEIAAALLRQGMEVEADIAGEGPLLAELRSRAAALGLSGRVRVHGGLPRPALNEYYAQSHFFVLPSATEGWPKVIGEAMAFGSVPVATAVGSIPQILEEAGCGVALADREPETFAAAIAAYRADPARWQRESAAAVAGAARFGYPEFVHAVARLFGLPAAEAASCS